MAFGVKASPFCTLLFHVYEVAPEPFRVTAVPAHTVWLAPAFTVGNAFTVMVWDCVVVAPSIVIVQV